MSKKLKIAFAGTPDFALPSLESLFADSEIIIEKVFTQPDRPVGRGQKIAPPPVKILAEKFHLPVEQKKLTAANLPEDLDFLAVVAFGQILPSEVLALPRFGCVNLHASLLPKFRGASPIQAAILAGECKTGVSFQKISAKLDAGDLFASFTIPLKNENSVELAVKLAALGGEKFPEVLKKIAAGEITATPQDEAEATHCTKIQKTDGQIDWSADATEVLLRKARAFFDWPGVWTIFAKQNLKLVEFTAAQKFPGKKPGEVFTSEKHVFVATIDGSLELRKVQLAGKRVLEVADFVRGNAKFVGSLLE